MIQLEIIVKDTPLEMSQRTYENLFKYSEIIQWGRKNPISFCEEVFGIYLLDYQRYVFMNSWTKSHVVWCFSRSGAKSFMSAPYIMTRSMLFPSHRTYILAGTAKQANETYEKIEQITKKQITTLTSLTDIFGAELIRSNSASDGFLKEGNTKRFDLYNGAYVKTLTGAFDRNRGIRSNLNFYDEAAFSPEELFVATDPFLTQDADFEMGKDTAEQIESFTPNNLPNQRILASSASDVGSYFFRTYKDYATQMILGNKNYFVADIDCSVPLHPTINGMDTRPLISQDVIDAEIRKNPEKARREYYNIFSRDGGDLQPVKRATIIRNSINYLPEFNGDGKHKYIITYDPARSYDNSVISIFKIIDDERVGLKLRLVNCISLADALKKKHTPISTPQQIEILKQLIVDYNGKRSPDYENIEKILIDAGSGGGGKQIGDFLVNPWVDMSGLQHKGLIDADFDEYKELLYLYRGAIDNVKLIEPSKWKTDLFDKTIEMMGLDLIEFPEEYRGTEFFFKDDNSDPIMISIDQKEAFVQMDLLKEELINSYRYEGSNGSHRYGLPPDKATRLYDDRAYTFALAGWWLFHMRRKDITNPNREKINDLKFLESYASLF